MSEAKKNPFKVILKWIGIVLLCVVVGFGGLLAWMTAVEWIPEDIESCEVKGNASETLSEDGSLKIVTWNTGYGALGDNADFFMDGGTSVQTADRERVLANMEGMIATLKDIDPDVVFLQEVDTEAKRSRGVNEVEMFSDALSGYANSFAYNYRVNYIPYPLPTMGKVQCGILTYSKFGIEESTRLQLPCPFAWPERLGNLRRCLMVDRVPLEGSDKELILVNLHLEAYDAGEGKAAQTKMLKEVLEGYAKDGNYVIAGGDFNQMFSNVDDSNFPTFEGNWQCGRIDIEEFDGWQMVMGEDVPSCRSLDRPYINEKPEDFQFYMIDGFIVSENLQVDAIEVLDEGFKVTDHNPVVMNVTLK